MVAGDSSDDETDEEDNGTQWGRVKKDIIVGEEEGKNVFILKSLV